MCNVKDALVWITNILQRHNISFQVAGGLATRAYGSTRELADIDIDIAESDFDKIKEEVHSFITFGPDQFKDEHWDLLLMSLNYHGQVIDISGAHRTKIYNIENHSWEVVHTDFSRVNHRKIYDLMVPVIAPEELIAYKKILSRPIDLIDLDFLLHQFSPK
ncbi:MazG-related protein [Legionella anisa]|uniref:MazG-related protein n=1 Tax=Legionella anisa TaxID=28082 RepID=UPI0010418C4E|nr:MazG-related protein [Legionella anisa]